MKREEAIALIKAITEDKCTNLTGHDIILMASSPDKKTPEEFDLHIKTVLDSASLRCLEMIVAHAGYKLRSAPENGLIVIFKPSGIKHEYEATGIM